jgi:hypothetical protein
MIGRTMSIIRALPRRPLIGIAPPFDPCAGSAGMSPVRLRAVISNPAWPQLAGGWPLSSHWTVIALPTRRADTTRGRGIRQPRALDDAAVDVVCEGAAGRAFAGAVDPALVGVGDCGDDATGVSSGCDEGDPPPQPAASRIRQPSSTPDRSMGFPSVRPVRR